MGRCPRLGLEKSLQRSGGSAQNNSAMTLVFLPRLTTVATICSGGLTSKTHENTVCRGMAFLPVNLVQTTRDQLVLLTQPQSPLSLMFVLVKAKKVTIIAQCMCTRKMNSLWSKQNTNNSLPLFGMSRTIAPFCAPWYEWQGRLRTG